ncbi:MAG: hypothetical protein KDK44_03425 [Chlamydiia bacterium]|nr:hypothetical protein [Chlamydiia bacterium]MCP5509140.1 hypothetical protein [Chlamydiales bacterium]HPE84985.1 hypothetical protein [Chlamydiales bacterium]
MKILFLLVTASLFAAYKPLTPDYSDAKLAHKLASRHIGKTIWLLDNNTMWCPVTIQENWRSFSEWWRGDILDQPDERFLNDFNRWEKGSPIYIHSCAFRSTHAAATYRNSVDELNKCSHVLENAETGECVFVYPLLAHHLFFMLDNMADTAYQRGYNEGRACVQMWVTK